MRLLRSEEEVTAGEVITVRRLAELARGGYGDRLDLGWRPRSPAAAQALLDAAGLSGPFGGCREQGCSESGGHGSDLGQSSTRRRARGRFRLQPPIRSARARNRTLTGGANADRGEGTRRPGDGRAEGVRPAPVRAGRA